MNDLDRGEKGHLNPILKGYSYQTLKPSGQLSDRISSADMVSTDSGRQAKDRKVTTSPSRMVLMGSVDIIKSLNSSLVLKSRKAIRSESLGGFLAKVLMRINMKEG